MSRRFPIYLLGRTYQEIQYWISQNERALSNVVQSQHIRSDLIQIPYSEIYKLAGIPPGLAIFVHTGHLGVAERSNYWDIVQELRQRECILLEPFTGT